MNLLSVCVHRCVYACACACVCARACVCVDVVVHTQRRVLVCVYNITTTITVVTTLAWRVPCTHESTVVLGAVVRVAPRRHPQLAVRVQRHEDQPRAVARQDELADGPHFRFRHRLAAGKHVRTRVRVSLVRCNDEERHNEITTQ